MLLPFKCDHCQRDKWDVVYNSETKDHILHCANCGKETILEEVFGHKRSVTVKKPQRIVIPSSIQKSTNTVQVNNEPKPE